MTTQDPELSAALGWPGGISDPVLDRKMLLQMVAALRLTSKQALEALDEAREFTELYDTEHAAAVNERCHENITALRAALAQQAAPVQMHPSQFAELIKGKETMIGVPVYWSEWPTKETQ